MSAGGATERPLYTFGEIQALLDGGEGAAATPQRKAPPKTWQEAGGCDNFFTSLAGSMRARGMSEEAILAALAAENDKLEEPMDLARVRRIAKSVGRYEPREEVARLPCSDSGNAERFAAHNPDLRYCVERETWLVWDGVRWSEDRGGLTALHRAKLTVRKIDADIADCDDADIRTAMRAWAKKSESAERLGAMVRLARGEPTLRASATDFDRDPWILNVENGILDLRRGELRPHDRTAMCSKLAPVRFVAGARHPVLDAYLASATGGDEAFIRFLQRAIGYTLTGDTGAESLFLVLGPGGSGKTTLVEAFKDLLGDYALTAAARTLLEKRSESGHTSDVARMHGRRMICTSEIAKGKRLDSGLLKSLTGGERIVARNIYESDTEFVPMGKFWLAANDAPGVADDDSGMWRRIIRVPFVQVVPEAQRDPRIKETLRTDPDARSAILAWAVQGCLDWQALGRGRQGLAVPAVVSKATSDYKAEQDPIAAFLDEACQVSEEAFAEVAAMRRAFTDYCRGGATTPIAPQDFNARMEARGFKRTVRKIRGRAAKVWAGVGLLSAGTIETEEKAF